MSFIYLFTQSNVLGKYNLRCLTHRATYKYTKRIQRKLKYLTEDQIIIFGGVKGHLPRRLQEVYNNAISRYNIDNEKIAERKQKIKQAKETKKRPSIQKQKMLIALELGINFQAN